ncbi:hypothetical protein NEF87_001474 [Candidatus Lokiarchaeum ossiferum]|uniref:Peptidase S8/S53 domain-containing protein n=1 Tax=Candidatus Lokiarchaeum ossiferum TaxID=2951803 RepID=A0ABY6HNV3_9ARCH|nr:hypothetical protein NEF87_001474 [Candidatus Lokiarchaeum sp. B-35]
MKVKNFSFSNARNPALVVFALTLFILPMVISLNMTTNDTEKSSITQPELFNDTPKFDRSNVKLDGFLSEWKETNELPASMNIINDEISLMLMVYGDDFTLGGTIEPLGIVPLSPGYSFVHTTVDNLREMEELQANPAVLKIEADQFYGPSYDKNADIQDLKYINVDVADEFLPMENYESGIVQPHSVETREVMSVDDAEDLGYDGDGIVIQIHDTGVDFGHTALRNQMAVDENGYPLSLEPSGRMSFTALNAMDFWGDIFTPGDGTYELLDGWFSPKHTDENGTIYLAGYNNLPVNAPDIGFYNPIWQLFDGTGFNMPATYTVGTGINGNVTGFAFGMSVIHNDGTISITPFIEADDDDDGDYDTLYVDYESGFCITQGFLTGDSSWYDLAPFNFTGQVAHKNNANLALSKDVWNTTDYGVLDGYTDISLGSIANVLDTNNYTGGGIVTGIPADGKTLAHLWDTGGHGTGCAGLAASAPINYTLLENEDLPSDETFTIGGMSTEAKILATAGFSDSATTFGWLWAAGFEPDANGIWAFNPQSTHIANISSNSWGTSAVEVNDVAMGWDFETLFIDLLSVPGFLHPDYPGVLYLTSTGNGGSGMGTSKQPSQSTAAVAVGASTVNWWRNTSTEWNASYGIADQVIGWSDNGPSNIGYPKIDILAPGAFDWSLNPITVGNPYFYHVFGGTSASCPALAGGMALIYQAWASAHPGESLDPDMAKAIMKSTADDFGYDPYMQGTGRINVSAGVQYADGTSSDILVAYTTDATATAAQRYEVPYHRYFNSSSWFRRDIDGGLYYWDSRADIINTTSDTDEHPLFGPYTMKDTAIYGGTLFPEESYTSTVTLDGGVTGADFADVTFDTTYTAVVENLRTYDYYSAFSIEALFDIAQLRSADYFQLEFSVPYEVGEFYRDTFGGRPPIMYVGALESNISGEEDFAFVNYAYDNNNFQDLFLPTDFLQASEDPAFVRIRDPGFNHMCDHGLYYPWSGQNFSLSVRAFTRTDDSRVSVVETSGGEYEVTIDIETDAVPGMYEGYVIFNTTDYNQMLVPYGYTIAANVTGYEADGWTIVSDGQLTGRPNDNGLYGCADYDWRPETGDWRFYDIVLDGYTNRSDVKSMLLELEWVNAGSEMNMWVVDHEGYVIGETDYFTAGGHYISTENAGETKQRLLIDIYNYYENASSNYFYGGWAENVTTGYGFDQFTLIVHATDLDPVAETLPLENFSLKVAWTNESVSDFAVPTVDFSTPGMVETPMGVMITNSNFTANWSVVDDNAIPAFGNDAYNNTMQITSAVVLEESELLLAEDLVAYAGGMTIEASYTVFLNEGDYAVGELDWSDDSDFDLLIIRAGDPYDFDSDIFGQSATGAKPEHFEGVIPSTGLYEIVIEWFDNPSGPADVEYYLSFSVLGDVVYTANVDPGDLMNFDLEAAGVSEGTYLVTTSTAGWNFDHTVSTKFLYDTSAPVIEFIGDSEVEQTDTISLLFDVSDTCKSGNYTLLQDGVEVDTGDFEDLVSYDFTGTAIGTYEFELIADDEFGYSASETVDIDVVNYAPVLSGFELIASTTNISAVFNVADLSIADANYTIYANDIEVGSGDWVVGDVALTIYGDSSLGLADGNYTIRIEVIDGYGGTSEIQFYLTVCFDGVYGMVPKGDEIDLVYLHRDYTPPTVTITETCTETETETTTTEEEGGVPGFAVGALIFASLGAAALLIRKSKRS